MLNQDQLIMEFNKKISPTKFKEGGAAIFLEANKNHHKDILGIKFISPLLIKSLRLPVRSYTILERQKRPEEQSPCPIINTYEPINPQIESVINPLITIPI